MTAGPRQFLEVRFAQLSADLDSLFAESREQIRREFAEQLNQAVRRLRKAVDADEICATLAESTSRFAAGAMLFRIEDGVARNPRLEIPLSDAPALASVAETQDPVVTLAAPAQVSEALVELLGHEDSARAHLFPVTVRETVPALIYAWGAVQGPAIELLTQVAAAVWNAIPPPEPEPLPEPEPVSQLVTIELPQPVPQPEPAPKPGLSWQDLPSAEQQVHLRAQRFARVHVAELRLRFSEAVQSGRTRRNLYEALRAPIDEARQAFRTQFFTCPTMVDYLDLELTRTLAHDDPELLGQSYPGPLV